MFSHVPNLKEKEKKRFCRYYIFGVSHSTVMCRSLIMFMYKVKCEGRVSNNFIKLWNQLIHESLINNLESHCMRSSEFEKLENEFISGFFFFFKNKNSGADECKERKKIILVVLN